MGVGNRRLHPATVLRGRTRPIAKRSPPGHSSCRFNGLDTADRKAVAAWAFLVQIDGLDGRSQSGRCPGILRADLMGWTRRIAKQSPLHYSFAPEGSDVADRKAVTALAVFFVTTSGYP